MTAGRSFGVELTAQLAENGFEKFGSKWVLTEELALKRDLDALEDIVKRIIPLRRQIDLAVADNTLRWQKQQATSKLIDQIAIIMRRSAVGTDEEKKIQKQVDQLKEASRELKDGVDPKRFGGQPHMRAMLESLTLMHQQASVLAVRVENDSTEINQAYQKLSNTTQTWLKEHPELSIGPLFRVEQIDQAVRKARASINFEDIPMYLQGDQKRVGVVLSDQFPTVLTVCPKDNRLILTSNMAYTIGLRDLSGADKVTLPCGTETKGRTGKIPQVRMGSATLVDVSVIVLEPSDEHLGGFVGLKLLQAWNPTFAKSGISLSLDASNQASTASR
ncbi:hypothetical protein C5Y96_16585 [Blastopirellula marina]|uniref:Uncharacterized protein n=2 Tax=Pirellulales TaxID=2691354 RepID=A0A2S8F7U5_9BACT|nr:hypothetical protein C5Y96_16585 [Blastopirellula marina]RCS48419.1 hypothetical protein DTL36_16605 [Bremerella cremea]